MNIGILRNTFLPPSETFITTQMKYLNNIGVKVLTREVANEEYFDFQNLDITTVVDVESTKVRQKIDKVWYTFTRRAKKFDESIKKNDIQLIHAHFGVEGVYALPLCRKNNIPLITTFHGFDITRLPKFTLLPVSWLNYYLYINQLKKKGDLFIAVSQYIKQRLVTEGFPEDKIIVHYIGIDVERIPYKEKRNDDEITILAVGRLTEKKGTIYLIKAFEKLYKNNKNIKLVLVGDGNLRDDLLKYSNQLNCKDKIEFRGHLHNEEVIQEMLDANIFCLPSITASDNDKEGLGIVQLEAAATGLPVVASDSGGISDAIVDGETGYLVEEKNVNQLVEKLQLLIDDKSLRNNIGLKARKHIEKKFNVRIQSSHLERIYKELIN